MNELSRLKKKAKKLYLEATRGSDHSCGIALSDYIQGYPRKRAEEKFNEVWARVRKLDPSAPESPFGIKGHVPPQGGTGLVPPPPPPPRK